VTRLGCRLSPRADVYRPLVALNLAAGSANLDSAGAHLWTALFEGKHEDSAGDYDGLSDIDDLWAVPFDPADPVHTPSSRLKRSA